MSDYSNTCPQCGSPVPADARFCENCGASFTGGAAAASAQPESPAGGYGEAPSYGSEPAGGYGEAYGAGPQPGYNPAGGPEAGHGSGYGAGPGYGGGPDHGYGGYGAGYGAAPVKMPLPDSFAKRFFEDFCGSPLFLTFTILLTTQVLMAFIGNITKIDIFAILFQAPMIIIAIGLWLLFAKSKRHSMETGPFSLIRGGLIAQLVISIVDNACRVLTILLLFILGLTGASIFSNLSGTGRMTASYTGGVSMTSLYLFGSFTFLLPLVYRIALLIISILFFRSILATNSSVKTMLETGEGAPFIPNTARVLIIIQIVLEGLGLIGLFVNMVMTSQLNDALIQAELVDEAPLWLIKAILGLLGFNTNLGSVLFAILASMLTIAIWVFTLIIIRKLEATPFEGGYDAAAPAYGEDPWNGPAAY